MRPERQRQTRELPMPAMRDSLSQALRDAGKSDGSGPYVEPRSSTQARPGTEEKIEVMRSRIEKGESCFHPSDERLEPSENYPHSCRWMFGDGIQVTETPRD